MFGALCNLNEHVELACVFDCMYVSVKEKGENGAKSQCS